MKIRTILISLWFVSTSSISQAKNYPDLFHLRNLLYKQDFIGAEKILNLHNNEYLSGNISYRDYRWPEETLWKESDLDKPWLESSLKKWLKHRPNSAYANAILGKYYVAKGFDSRGGKWRSKTSDSQISEMDKNFKKALQYLDVGLQKNKNIISAHISMLNIIMAGNIRGLDSSSYIEKIPNVVKQRYAIWSHYLQTIVPRWGGSNDEIMHAINNVVPKYMKNISDKDIGALKDTITYDRMQMAITVNGDFQDGLAIGEESIEAQTAHPSIYAIASNGAQQLKNYNLCYEYGKTAVNMRPYRSEGWLRYGYCAVQLQKWHEANEAYRYLAHIENFTDAYTLFQLGKTYMHLHQYDKAYPLFKKSEELDQSYSDYTKKYTKWIESEQKSKMHLKDKDIYEVIGAVFYKK